MKSPNYKFIAISLVFVLLLITYVSAEGEAPQESSNPTQISIGKDINAEVQGATAQKLDGGVTEVKITKEGGYLKINDNDFSNIQPSTEIRPAEIKLDEKGNVLSCDFVTNDKGGTYQLGNNKINVPPNSRVTYIDGKAQVTVSDKTVLKEENMPTQASPGQKSGPVTFKTYMGGQTLELPNGNKLQGGDLTIENGKNYIGGRGAKIDNLQFRSADEDFKMRTFFDGQAHPNAGEDYISLNPSKREMYILSEDKSIGNLNFQKDNPFVKVGDGEYFNLRTQEPIVMPGEAPLNVPHKLELGISNPEGKIPQLDVKSFSDRAEINNGRYGFSPDNNQNLNSYQNKPNTGYDSAPMDIKFQEKTLLPEGKSLLVNSDNSYTVIKDNNPQFQKYNSLSYQETTPLSDSQKELINKIQTATPGIKYEGVDKVPLGQLQAYDEQVSQMSDSLKKSTNTVTFEPGEVTSSKGVRIGGSADGEGGVKLASDSLGARPYDTTHEFTHNLDGAIRKDPANSFIMSPEQSAQMKSELANELNVMLKQRGFDSNLKADDLSDFSNGRIGIKNTENLPKGFTANDGNAVVDKLEQYSNLKAIKGSKLDKEWLDIQNGGYVSPGRSSGSLSASELPTQWADGKDEPRNGFIRAYGSTNMEEDKATFVEQATYNPEAFKSLIDPKSPQYDARYAKKLDLLQQYGFISTEQYQKITSGITR